MNERRRALRKLEDGWNSDFTGVKQTEHRSFDPMDSELLALQSNWCEKPKPRRRTELLLLAAADNDEEGEGGERGVKSRASQVKSGGLNYDAPLFLEAMNSLQEPPRGRRRLPPRIMGGGSHVTSAHPPSSHWSEQDNADFANWSTRWKSVYEWVDSKKKEQAQAEKKKREEMFGIPHASWAASAAASASAAAAAEGEEMPTWSSHRRPSAEGTGTSWGPHWKSSSASYSRGTGRSSGAGGGHRWSSSEAERERQRVRDLPDYPQQHQSQSRSQSRQRPPEPRADQDTLWALFEDLVTKKGPLQLKDIPWPSSSGSVIGLASGDSETQKKKKVKICLRRWHPDKFQRILNCIASEEERTVALKQVQAVTQRIIEEKERAGL